VTGRAALVGVVLALGCGERAEVVVGSKKFTESVVLGDIAAELVDTQGNCWQDERSFCRR